MDKVVIKGQEYQLPIFLPDATRGVTKSVDSVDLKTSGVRGAVVNTYHLLTNPGIGVIKKTGGIKKFMNFSGLIASDSGGWQVFSLIHRNNSGGKITDEGVVFSIGGGKKELFTPEMSVAAQFDIGSDIVICLDDFSPPRASYESILASVNRTTIWAKRSRHAYDKQVKKRKMTDSTRPLILAVVQGDRFKKLRRKSAAELINIGFDGYGYGGYPIDDKGRLDLKLSEYIATLLPEDKLKFALGVGRLEDIYFLANMGWDIFDCTLPTRDARHNRLYIFTKPLDKITKTNIKESIDYTYINKSKYSQSFEPLSKYCDCFTCSNFSTAYLHHLVKINDTLAYRLSTIHNLRNYSMLVQKLARS